MTPIQKDAVSATPSAPKPTDPPQLPSNPMAASSYLVS